VNAAAWRGRACRAATCAVQRVIAAASEMERHATYIRVSPDRR
jgi:hypothetical protein